MAVMSSRLMRSRLMCNSSSFRQVDIRSYNRKSLEFPFKVYCTCTGDFRLSFIVGIDVSDLKFKFERVQVPVELLSKGFFYANSEYVAGEFRGSLCYYKDSITCVESHDFTSIESFNNGLEQCSSHISDISNITLFKSILNGLYILTRQYAAFSLSFSGIYLAENTSCIQGYLEDDKIVLTRVGKLRDSLSTISGTQYYFKVTKKKLGITQESYIKSIENDKLTYTSSVDKCMRLSISEYSDTYTSDLAQYDGVVEILSSQKGIDFEVLTEQTDIQVDTAKLLSSLHLPFSDSGIAAIKRVDTKELSNHSDKMSLSVSFIEVYAKNGKFVGYVHGCNKSTFEVRKSSLVASRLEWQTDSKLKCSDEESEKIAELLSNLSSSVHNEQYVFKINRYTVEKFVRAVDLR